MKGREDGMVVEIRRPQLLDLGDGLVSVLLRLVHVTGLHRVHDSDDVHQHTQVLLQDQKVTLAKSLALLKSVLAD